MDVDSNLDPQLTDPSGTLSLPEAVPQGTMKSNLRLFPPPLFSRQTIPQGYKYAIVCRCMLVPLSLLKFLLALSQTLHLWYPHLLTKKLVKKGND